jgi:hypothetical protein
MHTCCFNSRLLGTEAASNEEEILVWPAGSYYFLDRRLYSTCDPAPGPAGWPTHTASWVLFRQASKNPKSRITYARSTDGSTFASPWKRTLESTLVYSSLSLPAEELAGS